METRDQWYKSNLLYNIHWRPPKAPETQTTPKQPTMTEPPMAPETPSERPKMIVKTVQFNPSVCTCGEHDCKPRYRMERKVVWIKEERSKCTKEKVGREDEVEISEHPKLQRLKQSDIMCIKEEKGVEEKGFDDNSENKTADNETEHIDRKGVRNSDYDNDNTELTANMNNEIIGDDRGGDDGLKTEDNGSFGIRGNSLGTAENGCSSNRRKRCFRREHANESDANIEGHDQIASDLNSHNAGDVFEKSNNYNISGLVENGQVDTNRDDGNVGCEGAKTKDIGQSENNEGGCIYFKGGDEHCNDTKTSVDFNDSKRGGCFGLNGYRKGAYDVNVYKNEHGYAKGYMRERNRKDDCGGTSDDAAENGNENDVDLKMLNSDDHNNIRVHNDLSVKDDEHTYQEDEISPVFGILSMYCNSEIHFMVESTWGRNTS